MLNLNYEVMFRCSLCLGLIVDSKVRVPVDDLDDFTTRVFEPILGEKKIIIHDCMINTGRPSEPGAPKSMVGLATFAGLRLIR